MIQKLIATISKDGLMIACGITLLILFLFITYVAAFVKVANPDVMYILVGQITTLSGGLVTYYFGSSKSSAEKTKIMADKAGNSQP